MKTSIPIEVSARHVHLSAKDTRILFGSGYKLISNKELSQPNQFVAKERVDLVGPKQKLTNVAIVGPERGQTQVEISQTDVYILGLSSVPLLASGDLEKSGGNIKLIGSAGEINLTSGVIVAQRHLHISPAQAAGLGIKNGDVISVKTAGERSVIFSNIIARSRENIDNLALHLDTDDANAAGLKSGDSVEIINNL